jgi:2,4-dichlorophenol 6-monooxygenase
LSSVSPMASETLETDVLIVGSGPAGSAAAALLSTYGIDNVVVTKYRWTANTPRAHITNQGAMEVFRDLGIEDEVSRLGTAQEYMGNNVFCTSLAGEELGRLKTWGTHPARMADYTLASPTRICDIPQHLLEPVLLATAAGRGTRVRLETEYLDLVQDDSGVTATVLDRAQDRTYDVRAKYMIGADGGRSRVAEQLGLPMEGQMDVAGSMNIVFEADLSQYVEHRPSVLYWVMQPGSDVGGIGMGLVRMVRPWYEWLIVWGYDIGDEPPVLDDAEATRIAHELIGDDTIPVTITSTSLWSNNHMSAKVMSSGRVFCAGDACHRHPPSNGLGSNTSIQDAYNLAWKLAHVLRGQADASLLDTYTVERAPIAKQVVDRANKSIGEFGPIFEALGLLDTKDPEQMRENMRKRKDATPEAEEQRARLRAAIELKSYEFNAHGVELGQRYRSAAVLEDGTPEPEYARDPELHYHPTTWPGARLPHVWLSRGGEEISTRDLAGHGRFALLTGINGAAWADAARAVAERSGTEIAAYVIGPGQELEDTYDDWARAREVTERGCVLVRPDAYVAWRSHELPDDPEAALGAALASVLGKAVVPARG